MGRLPGLAKLLSVFRFLAGEAGSVAPIMALLLIPLAGTIAFGTEQAGWFYLQRSTQNAADAAALAAATNNSANTLSLSTFQHEAAAAARPFGFVDGVNNATVATATVTCPANTSAGGTCYKATITTLVPLSFSQVVGFTGSTTVGSQRYQKISSSAIAIIGGTTYPCVWTKYTGSNSLRSNGGSQANLQGCTVYSAGDAQCNGNNLLADFGFAVGTDNGCGVVTQSHAPALTDPYSGNYANIPANTCSSYPQGNIQGNANGLGSAMTVLPAQQISGTMSSTSIQYCGDIQLSGDVTLTGSNTTFVVENGMLDTNGHTISTASGASATIIFSGTNTAGYHHFPYDFTNNGTINVQAPQSGNWSGIAMYQDPRLTNGSNTFTYAGQNPTWDITGLVYMALSDLTFKGAVNKSSYGVNCFLLVSYTMLLDGTANIFKDDNSCPAAGLTIPGESTIVRPRLVQ